MKPRPKSRQLTKRTYQEFAPPPTKTAGKSSRMEAIFSGIAELFADSAKNKHCDSALFQGNLTKVVMLKHSLRFSLDIP